MAAWTTGMAALHLESDAARALPFLDTALEAFSQLGLRTDAATTQLTRMHALGLIGQYDRAIAAGQWASEVFLADGDGVAAGRVDQNLGNLFLRRDDYAAAEDCYRSARDRFLATSDGGLLARAENNLGYALLLRHRFADAGDAFLRARQSAIDSQSHVTLAEIEDNLGCLGLVQGRYDDALGMLESARRRFVGLGMPHEAALAERELADAYLELNLIPEAAEIYARVVPAFAKLGLRAEHAWAVVHQARAYQAAGDGRSASLCLTAARALYVAEDNAVGVAMVTLAEAQVAYGDEDFAAAAIAAATAEQAFGTAGATSRLLFARWLRSDAYRRLGRLSEAQTLLSQTLEDASQHGLPQIALRCQTALGLVAHARAEDAAAEIAFTRAADLLEALRDPLPGEHFRAAFLGQHLLPYQELTRLCLGQGRITEALLHVERGRSRALLDLLGVPPTQPALHDAAEQHLVEQLEQFRHELNWIYTQLDRAPTAGTPSHSTSLEGQAHERESAIGVLSRQLQQGAAGVRDAGPVLDIGGLQRDLGEHSVLVEYFSLDGELLAFVVSDDGIEVVRRLGDEQQVGAAVEHLRFQIEALQFGSQRTSPHLAQVTERARSHLGRLYDLLLRPLEPLLGQRRLVVVPHRWLHYVPFQALFDGRAYVVERREVVSVPSAAILRHCLALPRRRVQSALLVGVSDAAAPGVRDEVLALAPFFPERQVFLDDEGRLAAVKQAAPGKDVVHLACHGQFRPDNPLFSSLRLADGWLTVRDAYELDLRTCQLAVLSACETGMSEVVPGDELLGLARGFLSAGTPALLVSLWTVDDMTTTELMSIFYTRLHLGDGPATALRSAQRAVLEHHPHPFFWAPFSLVGRW